MPTRTVPLITGEYYHIFNRGVARAPIFSTAKDYQRFLKSFLYYRLSGPKPRFSFYLQQKTLYESFEMNDPIVEIIAYCLMPNHFHFLVKQLRDGGVSEFVSKLTNSYTKYFNTKEKRVGPLFQGEFKSVHIETIEQLIHVSRYIHLNPVVAALVVKLEDYVWSSYSEYVSNGVSQICSQQIVLSEFGSKQVYSSFVHDHVEYANQLASIKHLLLE